MEALKPSPIKISEILENVSLKKKLTNEESLVKDIPSRMDVNIERMPVFFFGTQEKKKNLEKQIFESKKSYKIYDITTREGFRKTLEISPGSIYGLLTSFDQDVTMVVWDFLYKESSKLGCCPLEISIPLSEFPKIMRITKQGWLYKKIEESVIKISNFEILQNEFIKVKQKNGELQTYEKKSLKLFYFKGLRKEEINKGAKKRTLKHYLEIEIPSWIRKNIDNFYTTSMNIEEYFSFKSGRTKKLYRFLDLIRYEKKVFIPYEKLITELWIDEEKMFHKKQALKRSFSPLLKEKYVKNINFLDKGLVIIFSKVKKRAENKQTSFEDIFYQEELAQELVEKLMDKKSLAFYKKIASKVPEDIIYRCLSLTKEIEETGRIKKTKGAIFTNLLKKECMKLKIEL